MRALPRRPHRPAALLMPRLHALEAVFDETGDAAVRADWERLREAGLPSQADHRSPTNAPHLTLVAAPGLPDDALTVARVRLGALLPFRVRAAGVVLLGGSRLTLARVVDVPDDVARRVLAVRVQVADRAHEGWLPHLTLARRLERADAQRALDAAGYDDLDLTVTRLRHWDPDLGRVRYL